MRSRVLLSSSLPSTTDDYSHLISVRVITAPVLWVMFRLYYYYYSRKHNYYLFSVILFNYDYYGRCFV